MNVVAFRLPGERKINIYATGNSQLSPNDKELTYFKVCPFDPMSPGFFYPLIEKLKIIPSEIIKENKLDYHFFEIGERKYSSQIRLLKERLQGDPRKKIVYSRRSKIPITLDLNSAFEKLCLAYPNSFIFFISTREFGTWLGASPELLLERKENLLRSISLAGTRKAGDPDDWDTKNIIEQNIVTDYILEIFKESGLNPESLGPSTCPAGPVEHIKTVIESPVDPNFDSDSILRNLSPTPALSGFPKSDSISIIKEIEGDRGLYGGYCGPVEKTGTFQFYVILRCAYLLPKEIVLFAGGGITYMSEWRKEWEETENKMKTIKNILRI